jgi:hypothetical protein
MTRETGERWLAMRVEVVEGFRPFLEQVGPKDFRDPA